MAYTLTFWGTRGSIPTPGPQTARYGGNTPCVAVQREDAAGDRLVIMDAGTGIRPLGKALVGGGNGPLQLDLLVTHTHWDHIQGLPFFSPFFGDLHAATGMVIVPSSPTVIFRNFAGIFICSISSFVLLTLDSASSSPVVPMSFIF